MGLYDVVRDSPAAAALDEVARQASVPRAQVDLAVEALIDGLSRHLERNTLSRGGLADLVAAVGDPHHGRRLDDPALLEDENVRADGNAILGHIVGGKDASRALAAEASRASGLTEQLIKMLLPYVASLLMAALQRMLQGGFGDILKRLPQAPGGGGGRSDRPTGDGSGGGYGRGFELPRQGPIDGLPDNGRTLPDPREHQGRDEPMQRPRPRQMPIPPPESQDPQPPSGSFPEQSPLPLPGDRPSSGPSPFDDISDILRRGSRMPVSGGGTAWSVVRNALGSLLGFTSRGVIGWLVRLIVVRFGWRILRRLLGGVLPGR